MPIKTVKPGKAQGQDGKQAIRPRKQASHAQPLRESSIYLTAPHTGNETNRQRRERLRKQATAQGQNERNARITTAPMHGTPKRYQARGIAPHMGRA